MTTPTTADDIAAPDVEARTAVLSELSADRAIVLVGDEHEVWDFPREMLPARVETGTYLLVDMEGGRPAGVRVHEEHEQVARKGMDARLARLARYEQLTGTEIRIP